MTRYVYLVIGMLLLPICRKINEIPNHGLGFDRSVQSDVCKIPAFGKCPIPDLAHTFGNHDCFETRTGERVVLYLDKTLRKDYGFQFRTSIESRVVDSRYFASHCHGRKVDAFVERATIDGGYRFWNGYSLKIRRFAECREPDVLEIAVEDHFLDLCFGKSIPSQQCTFVIDFEHGVRLSCRVCMQRSRIGRGYHVMFVQTPVVLNIVSIEFHFELLDARTVHKCPVFDFNHVERDLDRRTYART